MKEAPQVHQSENVTSAGLPDEFEKPTKTRYVWYVWFAREGRWLESCWDGDTIEEAMKWRDSPAVAIWEDGPCSLIREDASWSIVHQVGAYVSKPC
jgi:hypothetical protein